jgi:hypothetical protein
MARNKTVTKTYSYDHNGDGVTDSVAYETTTFDRKGNQIQYKWAQDYDMNGTIDYSAWTDNTFDRKGNIIKAVNQGDYTGDGVVDWRSVSEYEFKKGVQVSELTQYDNDGENDGQLDFDSAYRSTVTLDKRGNVIERLTEYDGEGDGNFEWQDRFVYEYNKANELVYEVGDYGNDGTWEYQVHISTDVLIS